jgi:hydroxymethylbilane synthase
VECRDDDAATQALFAALDDAPTRTCVEAERAMNRALHGSCHVPVAAYAHLDGQHLYLAGLVGSATDGRIVRAHAPGRGDMPEGLGLEVAEKLLAQGARALIDAHL